jgi:hypothetical protein
MSLTDHRQIDLPILERERVFHDVSCLLFVFFSRYFIGVCCSFSFLGVKTAQPYQSRDSRHGCARFMTDLLVDHGRFANERFDGGVLHEETTRRLGIAGRLFKDEFDTF